MNPFVITLALWTVFIALGLLGSAWFECRAGQKIGLWGVNAMGGTIVLTAGVVLFLTEAGAL